MAVTCSACAEWPVSSCPECGPRRPSQVPRANSVVVTRVEAEPGPPVKSDQLRVVAAASRVRLTPEGTGDPRAVTVTISAPPPARHHNLFAVGEELWPAEFEDSGFLLSDGSYADRVRAAAVAIAAGQIKALAHPPYLYSEDLW